MDDACDSSSLSRTSTGSGCAEISMIDDVCDAQSLSGTSTGPSSSGEELRDLFNGDKILRFGDHYIYAPSFVRIHNFRALHILALPASAINPFGNLSSANLQCISPVYCLFFDASPGSLDLAASEEEGILHRDAVMQPQMLLLGCSPVRHCHCQHLLLIHLHHPLIEMDSSLSCLGLVALPCALQTQCVLSLVFVSHSLTSFS